jgi:hypothetical protein
MGATALLTLVVAAAGSPPAAGESAPFSLTLQGAASLGTYEAAMTWTLIRLIRSDRLDEEMQRGRWPRLEGLSGSSAGGSAPLPPPRCVGRRVDNLRGSEASSDSWLPIGFEAPSNDATSSLLRRPVRPSAFTPVSWRACRTAFSGKSSLPPDAGAGGLLLTRVVPQPGRFPGCA